MSQPKFIITMDGHLRLGMVRLHKDLLKPGDRCLGGGFFRFDYVSNRMVLEGKSYDFGPPLWHLLNVLKVPVVYRGLLIVYYTDGGDELILCDDISIVYVDE